jgi:hypothetical protein
MFEMQSKLYFASRLYHASKYCAHSGFLIWIPTFMILAF